MMPQRYLLIQGSKQTLVLIDHEQILFSASVSTALKGFGEELGSEQTPRGWFQISEKMGAHLPVNSVLVGRKPTGEIYDAELAKNFPQRDWILTRILWLDGLEAHNKNSKERYIYLHGTPEVNPMGVPLSHGCVRMTNADIIKLFDLVEVGNQVLIQA